MRATGGHSSLSLLCPAATPVVLGRVLGLLPKVSHHSASSAIKRYSPSAKKRGGIDGASLCQALNEDLDGS